MFRVRAMYVLGSGSGINAGLSCADSGWRILMFTLSLKLSLNVPGHLNAGELCMFARVSSVDLLANQVF